MLSRSVKWLISGLLGLSLIFGMAAVAIPGSQAMAADVKLKIRADQDDAAEAIFFGAMADYFDVDTKVVIDLSRECNDHENMIDVFYRSGETGRPIRRVIREERRDYVRSRRSYIRFISEYYGVSRQKVRRWLNQGLTAREIVVGLDIADEYNVNADGVMKMRLKGQSWRKIRKRCDDRWDRRRHGRRRSHRDGHRYRRGPRFGKKIIINF